MTEATVRPYRPAWRARLMGIVNVPMRVLLRLPFATPFSGQLMLLSFTGRKTGKAYQQPVSYVRYGDTLLTPGGGKWKSNLREGEFIQGRLRGRGVLARPEFIKDVDAVERLLLTMKAVNPRVTTFVPVNGPNGQIDRSKVEAAVSHGFRIIRWHLDAVKS